MSALPVIEPPTTEIPTCCGSLAARDEPVTTKFHFSLNVSELPRSVAFYEKLFGVPPAKHYDDYAKFELDQPPLVFSLVPNAPASQGALSHMGFPVSSREDVEAVGKRLEQAGLSVCTQDGTVCGYARQDKIWVSDPDHLFWEVYVVHEDVDPWRVNASFDGASRNGCLPQGSTAQAAPRQIWEHRVAEGPIKAAPCENDSQDEVRLTGTFNDSLSDADRQRILKETLRVLKPGALVNVHGLIASERIQGAIPTLPGVAALVKRIPTLNEILDELTSSGLSGVQITRLPEKPAFSVGGIDMHEVKIRAGKPKPSPSDAAPKMVIYKGPFAKSVDGGVEFPRGVRVAVTGEQWESLANGASAASYVFVDSTAGGTCGCG